jgi:predicted nuclease with RNAse H fold
VIVLGVDLSGPANVVGTAVVSLREQDNHLRMLNAVVGVGDAGLLDLAGRASAQEEVVIGLDAPLSYNPGGGDRPADSELRALAIRRGLRPGSVMPPTTTRMVYLTLRGLGVARSLSSLGAKARIVEVHPAAALVLRGAKPADVRELTRSATARRDLLSWIEAQGLRGAGALDPSNDHLVAACAAALAAWGWSQGQSAWVSRASPPEHPYDFAC